MYIAIEVSRPFMKKPSLYRCQGVTTISIAWLFFAVSLHPMRRDEMIKLANDGVVEWGGHGN